MTRSFNLSGEELDRRILRPWIANGVIELDERKWSAEKAKLTILEGPELETSEMGLGRGWANAARAGRDVTGQVLEHASAAAATPLDEASEWLKKELTERVRAAPLSLHAVLLLASDRYPAWRVSDRVAISERAVWELLHQREVRMLRDREPVAASEWEAIVLAWASWSSDAGAGVVLAA